MKKEKPSFQYSICLIIFWWNKKRVGGGDLKEKNYMNLYLLIFIKEDRQADAWECTWWLVCKLYIILNFAHWYSQTLNKLFIINAGSGFRMVWKVIKTFLDARTISKIQVRTFLVNSFLGRGSLLLSGPSQDCSGYFYYVMFQVLGHDYGSKLREVIDPR